MTPRTASGRYLQWALATVCLACSAYLVYEFTRDQHVMPSAAGAGAGEILIPGEAATQAPDRSDHALDEMLARPLFSEDRRPVPGGAAPAQQTPVETVRAAPAGAEDLVLTGVVITGDQSVALIRQGREQKLLKLIPGDSVDGWTLNEVRARSVSLARGAERRELELKITPSPVKPRAAAPEPPSLPPDRIESKPAATAEEAPSVPEPPKPAQERLRKTLR